MRIFCGMAGWDGGYASVSERHLGTGGLARRLRLDDKTIRSRVRRMERDGFIRFYQADVHLGLLGMAVVGTFRLDTVNLTSKRNLLVVLRRFRQVVETHDYLGPTVLVRLSAEGPEALRELVHELTRDFELVTIPLGESPVDPPPMTLDQIDWRIVQALRFDGRRTTRELARELGITERMAKYRIARLMNSRAMVLRAVLDPQHQHGLVFYELELVVADHSRAAVVERLRKTFGDKFWSMHRPTPGVLLANLFGFTLAEPEAAALSVQGMPGVDRCDVFIQKESVEPDRPSWIDRWIAASISGPGSESALPTLPGPRRS